MNESALVTPPSTPSVSLRRLLAFAIETHPPLVYALVSAGWAYSLLGLLRPVGSALPASAPGLALLFFLVLLYLRAIDEIKDLPYDQLHHPDRPLVRGSISPREVSLLAAGVALLVLALSAWMSAALLAWVAAQLAYGLGLLVLERRWQRFREHMLLNLAITVPVSTVLNVEALVYLQHTLSAPAGLMHPEQLGVIAAHLAVFLHMEFGRKLTWPTRTANPTAAAEHSYSSAMGLAPAVSVCVALALAGGLASTWLHHHRGAGAWAALPCAAWALSAIGLWQFARNRDGQQRALKPWFGGAMVLFYGLSAAVGAWAVA